MSFANLINLSKVANLGYSCEVMVSEGLSDRLTDNQIFVGLIYNLKMILR